MIQLGGPTAWRVHKVAGNLGVAYHWVNGKPAMCLYPLTRVMNPKRPPGAYIIPLESAFKYASSDGHPDLHYCIDAAHQAAEVMQVVPTRQMIRHIVDAIVDGLPDLVVMPPEPRALKPRPQPVGELVVKREGETVLEREV